uniref:streptomycin biosynthesis protein n=1 Tax=Spongiactinospora rosea TaxID=2248750 RepID=UPI00384B6F5B
MHRVQAARLRGEAEIDVKFHDGDEAEAFVVAVRANTTHGLPLTLTDRTAAATKILELFPAWSDRAIARAAGLSAGTVGAIRRRATVDSAHSNIRLSRDGRKRPVTSAEARRRAGELINRSPKASLREIAKSAGVSAATVRDVRMRLAEGRDPVPEKQLQAERRAQLSRSVEPSEQPVIENREARGVYAILERLRKDPSLRSSEAGRTMLRLLSVHAEGADKVVTSIDGLPAHCTLPMLEIMQALSQTWASIADDLRRRLKADPEPLR